MTDRPLTFKEIEWRKEGSPIWSFTEDEMYHLRAILSDIFWRMEPIELPPGIFVHPPMNVPELLAIFEKKIARMKELEMNKLMDPMVWPVMKESLGERKVLISETEYNKLKYGTGVDNG